MFCWGGEGEYGGNRFGLRCRGGMPNNRQRGNWGILNKNRVGGQGSKGFKRFCFSGRLYAPRCGNAVLMEKHI